MKRRVFRLSEIGQRGSSSYRDGEVVPPLRSSGGEGPQSGQARDRPLSFMLPGATWLQCRRLLIFSHTIQSGDGTNSLENVLHFKKKPKCLQPRCSMHFHEGEHRGGTIGGFFPREAGFILIHGVTVPVHVLGSGSGLESSRLRKTHNRQ